MRPIKITQSITRRDESASVELYLAEVSKIPLISSDLEFELSERIKQGDAEAKELLIKSNLRFVISVAKQYQDQGLSLMDLINEGNIGLIKAAEKFDATKGFKFITYAVWWIRQNILLALADSSRVVRIPNNQLTSITKIKKMLNDASHLHSRDTTPEEIANDEYTVKDINNFINMSRKPLMMDSYVDSEEGVTYGSLMIDEDSPSPEEGLLNESLKIDIKRALNVLTEKERDIISKSFGLGQTPMSNEDIAEEYDLCTESIRQTIRKALIKMKRSKGRVLSTHR